jgi:hypothetical protein
LTILDLFTPSLTVGFLPGTQRLIRCAADKNKGGRALAVKLSPPFGVFLGYSRCLDSLISPSRSARSQAFEGRGLFLNTKRFEDSLVLFTPTESFTQSKPAHDVVVLLDVYLFQVIEQTSPVLDHLQQAAPRVIVFLVYLEMLGEFVDSLT